MNRRDRLRIAGLSAWPLLAAIALYGALAASGVVPVGALPALGAALAVRVAFTYIRTAGALGRSDRRNPPDGG